ncbi:uncharacterized protein LOC100176068 [Ciona intestinalis]
MKTVPPPTTMTSNETQVLEELSSRLDRNRTGDVHGRTANGDTRDCTTITFPDSCNINVEHTNVSELLNPPYNIPYCQRVPCVDADENADSDEKKCLLYPGCYFDKELSAFRKYYGHAVMPGIPVCHQVIRNDRFLQLAQNLMTVGNYTWNALHTNCLLHEYHAEIYERPTGCYILTYLEYADIYPKHYGWKDINVTACVLIGGCYFGPNRCYYPANPYTNMQISSSMEAVARRKPSFRDEYGQQMCRPISMNLKGAQYLSAYDNCLKAGCAIHPSFGKELLDNLHIVTMESVPRAYQPQFWGKAVIGEVRADNWEAKADRMVSCGTLNIRNPFGVQYASGSNINLTQLLSNSNNFSSPNVRIVPFALTMNLDGSSTRFHPSLPRLNTLGKIDATTLSRISLFSKTLLHSHILKERKRNPLENFFRLLIQRLRCPYLNYFNLEGFQPMRGSFEGCCDQTLCYTPREDILGQYSGSASYWSLWGQWLSCSRSCGSGVQVKRRVCIGRFEENHCTGDAVMEKPCSIEACPKWSRWSSWGPCTDSCGGGQKLRVRVCLLPPCEEAREETTQCSTDDCPLFGQWGTWSTCSLTCGIGINSRRRTCNDSMTSITCPANTHSEVLDTRPCHEYCGSPVRISVGPCRAYPYCVSIVEQKCEYVTPNGVAVNGHCRNFKRRKKIRCMDIWRTCNWCTVYQCEQLYNNYNN